MKICQINCVYGSGSTGKIVRDLHLQYLEKGLDSYVVCPIIDRNMVDDKNVFAFSNKLLSKISASYRRLLGDQFGGALIQTSKLIKTLRSISPDIVHVHCINGNNFNICKLLKYLAKNNISTIITLHAEFMYTGGCGHAYECNKWLTGCGKCPILKDATQSFFFDKTHKTWLKLKKTYSLFSKDKLIFTAVSPWLLSRFNQAPVTKGFSGYVVKNGVDTNIFKFYEKSDIIEKLKADNPDYNFVVLHVTARFDLINDNNKGGLHLIELSKKLPEILFVVASGVTKYNDLPKNVVCLGKISDQVTLAGLYSASNLSLILGKKETFSMPLAESLCCGTPVVGFKAGGPESIESTYATFVEYGNVSELALEIRQMLIKNFNKIEISNQSIANYSKYNMSKLYVDLYKQILD